jgi:dehydrogenase/reductase SDR family member 12
MDAIRKMQFMYRGYKTFTKNEKPFPAIEADMTGKNFVVTGGNSGIGYSAAKQMAKLGANVYLVCRNPERGEKALEKLREETGSKNAHLILGDMGERDSMNEVARELAKKMDKIDIFVHNAGCMLHEKQFTKDKIEKNFAVNAFTIYYLTKKIMPMLHKNSRVVAVSSGGMLTEKINVDNLYMDKEKFDGTTQYARNKRQQMCIIEEFAKMYPENGLFLAMHPGWVDTAAVREAMPDFHKKFKDVLKSEDEGSDTIVWLSTVPQE